MTMRTPLFDAELRGLVDRPLLPGDTVLSAYLDASVNAHGKRDFEPFLNRSLGETRERAARLPVDLEGYDAVAGRVRAFATGTDLKRLGGLAVFAEPGLVGTARRGKRSRSY